MSLLDIGRRSAQIAAVLVLVVIAIGAQVGLTGAQDDPGGTVEVAGVVAGPSGDGFYADIALSAPAPVEIVTEQGQVFVTAISVQIHINKDFYLVVQADIFEDGAFFNGFCVEDPGGCVLDSFVVDGRLSDDRRRLTFFFGPLPGLDIAPEDMTVSVLTTRRFPDAETAVSFFPGGGGRIPAQLDNVDDPLSLPPPSDAAVPDSSSSAPTVNATSAPQPTSTTGVVDTETESEPAPTAVPATDADTSEGESGGLSPAVWIAFILVVALGGGLGYWYFTKKSEECQEELKLLNGAKSRVETAERKLTDAREALASAETALAPHETADQTEQGRNRHQHSRRLTEARQARDRARDVVAAAAAEAKAQRDLAEDAQYVYAVCMGLVEPRGAGVSDVPETRSSRPTTIVDDAGRPPAVTTEPRPAPTAPPVSPAPPPKPEGDDPRDTPPPVDECTEDDGPRFEPYGEALKDTLDLDYELSIDDTGLRKIEEAASTAEELDEIADTLDGLGDASDAAGDAIEAMGITPSVPAAGFGNALDTARAVLQTTAKLAAAAARFAGAVNRRNSMYLIKGQLHHYHVELQWVERWECKGGAWVCAGFELHRTRFERSATTTLDEDRETFPPTRSGMQEMHRRFQARQRDWANKVRQDQSKLQAYLDKAKDGPCA